MPKSECDECRVCEECGWYDGYDDSDVGSEWLAELVRTLAVFKVGFVMGVLACGAALYGPAALRYIAFGILQGDWMNDWLTHLPLLVQQLVVAIH